MPFTVTEERYELADLGLEIVGRSDPDPLTLAHLGLRGEAPKRWEDILFLDTETTGLSGGTGTYVFMLGTARIRDGELVFRQHVLCDLAAERRFVAAIHEEMAAFRACASYNGKSFDLPILRTRVVLALRADLSVDESHLDLLHPARRLWKDRFGSTTSRGRSFPTATSVTSGHGTSGSSSLSGGTTRRTSSRWCGSPTASRARSETRGAAGLRTTRPPPSRSHASSSGAASWTPRSAATRALTWTASAS